jgi:hypothetical protein
LIMRKTQDNYIHAEKSDWVNTINIMRNMKNREIQWQKS